VYTWGKDIFPDNTRQHAELGSVNESRLFDNYERSIAATPTLLVHGKLEGSQNEG
jgi:hypothetical protein